MAFVATRTANGQYFLFNDVTGEHMTVDSADEVSSAIDGYNQAKVDKAAAAAAAAAAADGPVAQPVVESVPGGSPDLAAAADAAQPVTNVN